MAADGSGRSPKNTELTGAANPDWSPDGEFLVFDYLNSIYISRTHEFSYTRLTNFTSDSRPRFSPDGTKIIFQSSRDGNNEIYVMNPDATGLTRLTNHSASDSAPVWSPDGTKILFTSTRDNPMSPSLYVMNADGTNQTRVTDGSDGVWKQTLAPPALATESGTNDVVALDSVTFLRGPFSILNTHNFSFDGHTRLILFTSPLGLVQQQYPSPVMLSVKASGIDLPVERVGPMTGVAGSYIIVRLPDALSPGSKQLTVTFYGMVSATTTLTISP
jgi:hypothetical protein